MSQETNRPAPGVGSQVGAALLVLLTFALIGFVALSVVTGNDFGLNLRSGNANLAVATPQPAPVGTPNPLALATFKQTALGFSLKYPRNWRKNEPGLQVILSPSAGGLDPKNLQDAAIWFGMPIDGQADPAQLLARLQTEYFPTGQLLNRDPARIGGQMWPAIELQFKTDALGPATGMIAATSQAGVGYFMVAVTPVNQAGATRPVFDTILSSFEFAAEAVLRPTDATPPPTPTATATPVFYIIQSGDTLSYVSAVYDVSIEAIMDRNGLDKTSVLHPGDKLIIPRKKQR